MKLIIVLFVYILVAPSSYCQKLNNYELEYGELKNAIDTGDSTLLLTMSQHKWFSIKRKKSYTFDDVPVEFLKLNNDFFLRHKNVRAEYTIDYSENGMTILLYDIDSDQSYEIRVNSASQDYFVEFYHGKHNYYKIKKCNNCNYETVEVDGP